MPGPMNTLNWLKFLWSTRSDTVAAAVARFPAKDWLWASLATRRAIQRRGINIVPSNFYSSIPSIDEIESSYEYRNASEPPYELRLDNAFAREELTGLVAYAAEFTPSSEKTDRESCERYSWANPAFTGADAMAYYCYVRKLKPKSILEIGSGYSTLVACEAVKANGSGGIHCVEPYPMPFLEHRRDIDLMRVPAQEITSEYVNDLLKDGDILFIDSTHTVKTGSDCLHLYLRLLPKVRRNIHVHAHDICLPFGMPQSWLLEKHVYWTEQYLLLALLTDNPKARVLYGSRYNHWRNPDLMERFMGGKSAPNGTSFWFEYRGA